MKQFLFAALLLSACTPLTDVVVRVDSAGVTTADISSVTITVTDLDNSDGGTQTYASQPLPLCASGQSSNCYTFPITITLAPGKRSPDAKVRVQVDATSTDGTPFSSDAALFSFTPHQSQHLDFFLSKNCGGTDCASSNLACGTSGTCNTVTTKSGSDTPDLASPSIPSTSVTLVSFQPGDVQAASSVPFSVPQPQTQAGDLVVIGFAFTNFSMPFAPSSDWSVAAETTEATALIYRYATGGESAATYTFPTPPLVITQTAPVVFATMVFRGAGGVLRGIKADSGAADANNRIVIPLDTGALVQPGGELVALTMDLNGSVVSCAPTTPVTSGHAASIFGVVEAAYTTGPLPASFTATCIENNPTSPNDIYSFVVDLAK